VHSEMHLRSDRRSHLSRRSAGGFHRHISNDRYGRGAWDDLDIDAYFDAYSAIVRKRIRGADHPMLGTLDDKPESTRRVSIPSSRSSSVSDVGAYGKKVGVLGYTGFKPRFSNDSVAVGVKYNVLVQPPY
jgi:hypothetical protein